MFHEMRRMWAVLALAGFCSAAEAGTLIEEHFNYPDGDVAAAQGTIWTVHSPTSNITPALIAGRQLALSGANNADVNAPIPSQPVAPDPLFASFSIRFKTLPSSGGSYFAHFRSGSDFRGCIWAETAGATPGKFRVAVSNGSSNATPVAVNRDLDIGATYMLVLRYDVAATASKLWVNPVSETDPSAAVDTATQTSGGVGSFAFRQASGIGGCLIDDLRLGTGFADVVSLNLAPVAATARTVFPGATDEIIGAFDATASGADLTLASFDLTAAGTGDDQADVAGISCFRDDGDLLFDPAADARLATAVYPADDGTVTINAASTVTAGATVRFYLTYDFAANVADGLTFSLTAGNPTLAGGTNVDGAPFDSATLTIDRAVRYSDTTAGAPTWNRPDETGAALSGVARAVPYHVQEIALPAGASGSYTITANWTGGQDGYLFVYENAFDPLDQFTGFVAGNDDYNVQIDYSQVAVSLTAGIRYFVVATGYEDIEYGTFDMEIAGPAPVKLVPMVISVSPAAGLTTGGTAVTIHGSAFTGATAVSIGGAAATNVTVAGPSTITCETPAGTAGPASVVVTTPDGTGAPNALFTFVAPGAPPTVASVSPAGSPTSGGTAVTINGAGFAGVTAVSFGGAAATNLVVVNATTITCAAPAGAAGSASVLVTTPNGTNGANTLFTYVGPVNYSADTTGGATWNRPDESGTGLSTYAGITVPYHVQEIEVPAGGTGDYAITATWSGWQDGFLVLYRDSFDPANALTNFVAADDDFTYIDDSQVIETLDEGTHYFIVATGYDDIDYGTFDMEIAGPATVALVSSVPAVTSVSPVAGPPAGGTAVTIRGSNFLGATAVTFDGVAATNVVVAGARMITCTTPPGNPGAVSVAVTTPNGTSVPNTLFTYTQAPTTTTIGSVVSPSTAPPAGPSIRVGGSGSGGGCALGGRPDFTIPLFAAALLALSAVRRRRRAAAV